MARENYQSKARRYVAEGRLVITAVTPTAIDATVRGAGAIYSTTWHRDSGWACNCEARGECCHVAAVKLTTAITSNPGVQ